MKKVTRAVRPTLEEVKASTGKLIYVEYRGLSGGGFGIPSPEPKTFGEPVLRDLQVAQFEPEPISERWLDDPYFEAKYNNDENVWVWKTDRPIEKRDLKLPDSLSSVPKPRQMIALQFARTEYNEPMQNLVHIEGQEMRPEQEYAFLRKEILPFLKCMKFYELKFTARPNVIRDLDKRIAELEKLKPFGEG